MNSNFIYGIYNDDKLLLDGAKSLIAKGVKIQTVYSPFPVHGLDKVLGLKWTRLAICSFLFGLGGMLIGILGCWYFMINDWPLNIGGKPSFSFVENVLAFVPVIFECAVLCAAHGMVLTFLFRSWLFPGVTARNPDPRTTDDHFAMEISTNMNTQFTQEEINSMLQETEVVEVFGK